MAHIVVLNGPQTMQCTSHEKWWKFGFQIPDSHISRRCLRILWRCGSGATFFIAPSSMETKPVPYQSLAATTPCQKRVLEPDPHMVGLQLVGCTICLPLCAFRSPASQLLHGTRRSLATSGAETALPNMLNFRARANHQYLSGAMRTQPF